eukprot:TRINITY_DN1633_c0_g1_i1.p1 TRINITY_DN1633_c0_g1~~TRINITY_DN1633_c0_g1_i1.p1  ORF type:complete len:353 (+),score=87.11 TRINITY_DN1633_c0_g1_i1:100-1158(+)
MTEQKETDREQQQVSTVKPDSTWLSCVLATPPSHDYPAEEVERENRTFQYVYRTIGILVVGTVSKGSRIYFQNKKAAVGWVTRMTTNPQWSDEGVMLGKPTDSLVRSFHHFRLNKRLWNVMMYITECQLWYDESTQIWTCTNIPLERHRKDVEDWLLIYGLRERNKPLKYIEGPRGQPNNFQNTKKRRMQEVETNEHEINTAGRTAQEAGQIYKEHGNKFYTAGQWQKARHCYDQAILNDPTNQVFYSNRSATWLKISEHSCACCSEHATSKDNALADAKKCIELAPEWAKGYYRLGIACVALGEIREAIAAFTTGVEKEPGNQELQKALDEAKEDLEELERQTKQGNVVRN